MPSMPGGGHKHMIGEAVLTTNPKKGRADKRKVYIQTTLGRVSRWEKFTSVWPRMNLVGF